MRNKSITAAMAIGSLAFGLTWGSAAAYTINDTVSGSTGTGFNNTHDLKRYPSPLFRPRDNAVTISGNVDLSNASGDSVILIGLVDADLYNNSGNPEYAPIADQFGQDTVTYQSGAYAYFRPNSKRGAGPTDGNDSGELVRNYVPINDNDIDFTLTISPDGSLVLTADGQTASDTYGRLKIRPGFGPAYTDHNEFANGAYLSVDYAAGSDPSNSSAAYSITASPVAAVPEPSSLAMLSLGGGLMFLFGYRRRRHL